MLRTETWTYFEGLSEFDDGTCVMRFYGQVNKADPNNILITEKEVEEDSYRKNVDLVRRDRRAFEDTVYAEAEYLMDNICQAEWYAEDERKRRGEVETPNCS